MQSVTYFAAAGDTDVYITGAGKLNPRNDLYNHSPDGCSWGYLGSGCAQLALGILAHHLAGDLAKNEADELALTMYQDFKSDVIANMAQAEDFLLDSDDVQGWIDSQADEQPGDEEAPMVPPEQTDVRSELLFGFDVEIQRITGPWRPNDLLRELRVVVGSVHCTGVSWILAPDLVGDRKQLENTTRDLLDALELIAKRNWCLEAGVDE